MARDRSHSSGGSDPGLRSVILEAMMQPAPRPTKFRRTDSLDDLAHLNHQAAVAAGGAMGPPKQAAAAAGGVLTQAEKTAQRWSNRAHTDCVPGGWLLHRNASAIAAHGSIHVRWRRLHVRFLRAS